MVQGTSLLIVARICEKKVRLDVIVYALEYCRIVLTWCCWLPI